MNEQIDDGDSAFPRTGTGNAGVSYDVPPQDGMSLRDWFAGMALGARVASGHRVGKSAHDIASDCYDYADAMLNARKATK